MCKQNPKSRGRCSESFVASLKNDICAKQDKDIWSAQRL